MKTVTLRIDPAIYPCSFVFQIGPFNPNDIKKIIKSSPCLLKPEDDTLSDIPKLSDDGVCYRCGSSGSIIWLRNRDEGCLVHEITHAVLSAGRGLGFKPTPGGEEFYCYLAQFLFKQVTLKWRER
jgi:hypothetical protein